MAVDEVAATLVREPLPARVAAPEALRALRGDNRPFALVGAWAGGGAVLGSEPVRLPAPGEDVLALLDDLPPVTGAEARPARGSGRDAGTAQADAPVGGRPGGVLG